MERSSARVSIIMPVYNASRILSYTIDSVLDQTFADFELIAIDDCSTDNSYDILCEYAKNDNRLKVYKNAENKGVSYTRNLGVSKAQSEFIALIDSDDMWHKDKLKKQLKLFDKFSDTDLCYTGCSFINANGVMSDYTFRVPENVDYKNLLKQNVVSCSSVVIKKNWLSKYPMSHDGMHEDFAVWLSVLKDGGVARGIDEPLLTYRVDRNSKSGNKLKSLLMTYRVYKYIGLNFFSRIYYMFSYIVKGIKKHSSI